MVTLNNMIGSFMFTGKALDASRGILIGIICAWVILAIILKIRGGKND